MKLLYVSPNSELGGAERILDTLIKYHHPDQFEIYIVLMGPGSLEEKWKKMGATVLQVPPFRFRQVGSLLKAQWAFRKILKDFDIELIHSTMAYGHLFAGPVALSLKVPEVWFQHGPVGKTLDRLAGFVPTKNILCNSKFTENQQQALAKAKSSVVYGPVEIPAITSGAREEIRISFRKNFDIGSEKFLCLHVARLDAWKGQENFIKAIELAHHSNPNIQALIVGGSALGSSDYEKKLKNLVQDKNLENVIGFTGFLSSVQEAFFSADLFVHCSIQAEPLGLSILEALAAGCPVIAADQGGPLEVIIDQQSGILCPASDIIKLSQTILNISQDKKVQLHLREQGLIRAQFFEAKKWVRKIEEIYQSLMSEGSDGV